VWGTNKMIKSKWGGSIYIYKGDISRNGYPLVDFLREGGVSLINE